MTRTRGQAAMAAPSAASAAPRGVGRLLGRRWGEALALGFTVHAVLGIPAAYAWLVIGAAESDAVRTVAFGYRRTQDWAELSPHLPIALAFGTALLATGLGACFLIARARQLDLFAMLLGGWLGFISPFAIWMVVSTLAGLG